MTATSAGRGVVARQKSVATAPTAKAARARSVEHQVAERARSRGPRPASSHARLAEGFVQFVLKPGSAARESLCGIVHARKPGWEAKNADVENLRKFAFAVAFRL